VAAILSRRPSDVFNRFKVAFDEWLRAHSARARRRAWRGVKQRSEFVLTYLAGLSGIEIGASAHNDFGLDAVNVDRFGELDTVYKKEERNLVGWARSVDLVAPGDDLPFADDAVDFVFASHVLEHFPDPIRALEEWRRVARTYVVAVVPHRDRTFDRDRELTPVDELLRRHEDGFDDPRDQHWTVWTLESFLDLCDRLGLAVVDSLDPDDKVGNGFIVVLDARPTDRHDAPPVSVPGRPGTHRKAHLPGRQPWL
jgi:SAM-dependent methyltransferase